MMRRHTDDQTAALFTEALGMASGARPAFLNGACGGNRELRGRVESLLAADERAGAFLNTPVLSNEGDADHAAFTDAWVGKRIDRYRIVETLASGGMGTVYRAARADDHYEQQVAIKLIRQSYGSERTDGVTASTRGRFLRERQALAQLHHPYITRLLDGGNAPDGTPYFVMEYVDGERIDRHCDRHRLTVDERLALFGKVCLAVHYAHQNLIVHRDLKPSNILVTADGIPKLLDFGISKLLNEDAAAASSATQTMFRVLTPRYASPEQIRGEAITTSSDVYSLGVILYELLTGHRPYALGDGSAFERGRVICEQGPTTPSVVVTRATDIVVPDDASADPTPECVSALRGERPHHLRRRLRGDLDNIVLMALQKDPRRRYASVQQFTEDIRRYLARLPLVARKDTFSYRAGKFIKRNRGGVLGAAAVVLALILGTVGTWTGMLRARDAQHIAQRERNQALAAKADAQEVVHYIQNLLGAANPYRKGRDLTVVELLRAAGDRIDADLGDRPAVEAGVRCAIANTFAGMWRWRDAADHLRIALRLSREIGDTDTVRVTACMSLLGRALTFFRDPESVTLQQQTLAIRRDAFGAEHPLVAESLGNLGFAFWHGCSPPRWDQAERGYRDALAMYHRLGIHDTADVARFTFSLGVMLSTMDRLTEAEPVFAEALAIYRRLPVGEDRYIVECMVRYARVLRDLGKLRPAEKLLTQALSLTPKSLLPTGIHSASLLLASVRYARGDIERAERGYRRILAGECRTHAVCDPDRSERWLDLARRLTTDDAGAPTVPYVPVFTALLEAEPAANNREPLREMMRDIAQIQCDRKRYTDAESLLRALLSAQEKRLPANHWRLAETRSILGGCLTDMRCYEPAESLVVDSYETIAHALGVKHRTTRAAAERMVKLREHTAR